MNIQKSFEETTNGTLYVIPTPIGNLEDITIRALHQLRSVSVIAAEDTRNTKKLLNHFEITTPLISYHEHNKMAREQQLLEKLANGEDLALVSDAGMPAISDPGHELVRAAIGEDINVVVLPGANAALCALVGSGLMTTEFLFYGFLPRKKKEKQSELERLKQMQATLIFYESPYRVEDTLKEIKEQLGGNRKVACARELTKRFEQYVRGTVDEAIDWAESHQLKGEFCIVVEGNPNVQVDQEEKELWWSKFSIIEHVDYYMKEKLFTTKDAIKQVANDRKMRKREVYQMYHQHE